MSQLWQRLRSSEADTPGADEVPDQLAVPAQEKMDLESFTTNNGNLPVRDGYEHAAVHLVFSQACLRKIVYSLSPSDHQVFPEFPGM
jgi:hypothetical protein